MSKTNCNQNLNSTAFDTKTNNLILKIARNYFFTTSMLNLI